MKKFICYYRVSTKHQERSGLGLEAQKAAAREYVAKIDGQILAEFTEVESGKKNNRPQLDNAIKAAKDSEATFLVANLDRLSRDVLFLFKLKEEVDKGKLSIKALDMPDFSALTLGIFATVAQHQREMISERTKAAFAAKKERGEKVGSPQNLDASARAKGQKAIKENAKSNPNSIRASFAAVSMRNSNYTLKAIAHHLEEMGMKTPRGNEKWTARQVKRLLIFAQSNNYNNGSKNSKQRSIFD